MKLTKPRPGEWIDRCQYTRTGWAYWHKFGPDEHQACCSCRPAPSPCGRLVKQWKLPLTVYAAAILALKEPT